MVMHYKMVDVSSILFLAKNSEKQFQIFLLLLNINLVALVVVGLHQLHQKMVALVDQISVPM
jgi:hypothetical protein